MTGLELLHAASPYLQAAATTVIAVLAGKATAVLAKVGHKQTLDTLRALAGVYVAAAETLTAAKSGPAKKVLVIAQIRQHLPWLPMPLIDAAIEQAVAQLDKVPGAPKDLSLLP